MRLPVLCARLRMPVCTAALPLILLGWFLPTSGVFGLGLGLLAACL